MCVQKEGGGQCDLPFKAPTKYLNPLGKGVSLLSFVLKLLLFVL